jgi:DNA (cytosine-5)-methyltransferase 1
MRIGSLFSGAGGLDMAVEQVFGGQVIWQSEVDKAASKVLAYRFPGVPNLGDITTIDWSWHQPVDILCGGFPCTDVSAAGKRAGMHGTRSGLWSEFAKAIENLRPRMVVIENVRGILSAHANRPMESDDVSVGDGGTVAVLRAAGAVLGDLADLRYDAKWTTIAASDVGAPHRRERVFIIATDTAVGGRDTRFTEPEGQRRKPVTGPSSDCAESVDLLPTPTAQAAKHGADSRFGGGNGDVSNLWQIAHLLPTPRNRDAKGATASRSGDNKHDLPSALAVAPSDDAEEELWPTIRNAMGYEYGRQRGNASVSPMYADDIDLDGLANAATEAVKDLPSPLRAQGKADATGKPPASGLGSLPPTPAAAYGQRGQDFARANREGSGGDDLVTIAVKADRDHQWGKYAPAIARWEQIVGPAPAPTEPNKNGNPRLSAAFSEWLMGWPAGWVTDPDIGISRNDQLRILGNGVVVQQATAALRYLLTVAS